MRLSTKETLDYLKANGYDIKERTYFEHKKELKKSKKERIINAVDGSVWNHFKLMDTLELVQQKLWKDTKTDDVNLRLKIYGMITQNEVLISKCHNELLSVTDRQIESYRAVEISDRLTYAEYQKFVLTNRLNLLKEKLNETYKDPLTLRDREAEDEKSKENIRNEIKKIEYELEKLTLRDDTS